MGLIFKDESFKIMGACYEVYREKGAGFVESIYHECLIKEFRLQKLPAVSEPQLDVLYKGQPLTKKLKPDFVCFSKVILEIKAVKKLTDEHRAQVLNYLRATGFKLGLLVNFGHYPLIESERIVLTTPEPPDQEPPRLS